MTGDPARVAGLGAIMAMVAGAANAAEDPPPPVLAAFSLPADPDAEAPILVALEAAYGPVTVSLADDLPGWMVVRAAEHCDCCAHRYGGGHVRGAVCPCASREAWDGAR